MPNGGPDNCATCGFNRVNEGRWGELSEAAGFCTIRHVEISVPHWTYCKNWHTRSSTPQGPIYASMYDEGYRRVPWFGRVAPETGVHAACLVCGAESKDGITLTIAEGSFGFCGREHYVAWRETTRIAQMRKFAAAGEQAYSEMYDAYSPAGFYSDAKDYFRSAMSVASELELADEEKELRARLEHIQAVFRSQFP
jgi:hypothetical protein